MHNRKSMIFNILLAAFAVVLAAVPVIWESTFAFAVFLGGLPIYIAVRQNRALGFVIYFSISIFSACINISEALFFICISGSIGLTLGLMKNLFRHIYAVPILSVLAVFTILSAVHYLLGISIFSSVYRWTLIQQAFALIPLLYVFCLIHLKLFIFAEGFILKILNRSAIDLF